MQVAQRVQTPRGLTIFLKTHFEIASYIISNAESSDKIITINIMEGIDGLYELAEDLTHEFENFIEDTYAVLEHDKFYDLLNDFLNDRLK